MKELESGQIGKLGEQKVISKLLERGLDVYLPIVDIHGIDCIIKTPKGKYIDVQIKTRLKITRNLELIDVRKLKARKNLFIIAYLKMIVIGYFHQKYSETTLILKSRTVHVTAQS